MDEQSASLDRSDDISISIQCGREDCVSAVKDVPRSGPRAEFCLAGNSDI